MEEWKKYYNEKKYNLKTSKKNIERRRSNPM